MVLQLVLKHKWFDKILSGEKTIEYREAKEYWINRIDGKKFDEVLFKRGYSKNAPKINAKILKIKLLSSGINTDLKIDKPVYAIYFDSIEVLKTNE